MSEKCSFLLPTFPTHDASRKQARELVQLTASKLSKYTKCKFIYVCSAYRKKISNVLNIFCCTTCRQTQALQIKKVEIVPYQLSCLSLSISVKLSFML